jgi:membrane protease YdiL (CAAX protease family)
LDAAVSALYFLSMNDGGRSRLVGWIALALASDLADICWYLHSGHRLPRVFVLLRALMLIPVAVSNRGPLRRFILALIAFLFGSWLQRTIEQHWIWYQHAPISRQMYADALLAIIPSLLIGLTLIRSGLSRGDVYLTRGRLTARVKGLGPMRWFILAPGVILFMTYGLSEQLRLILQYSGANRLSLHPTWTTLVGLSLTFAGINAFNEEFRFRFVLLAHGKRSFGASSALWMTSLNFGLAHWISGHPGGPTGALSTLLFALLLCRSLYDTEGGLWAWLMHAGGDVIIFAAVLFRVG